MNTIVLLMSSLLLMTMMAINAQVVADTSKKKDSIQTQCQEVRIEHQQMHNELKDQLKELKTQLEEKKKKKNKIIK